MVDIPTSLFAERVDEVIAAYLEAERAGQAPDLAELLAQNPDLADELRSFFADRDSFARLAGPPATPDNGASSPQQPMDPEATVAPSRYVGLAPHARGGLGEVFSATDTELHRVVALKRIRDHRADDLSSRRRFLLEAEVTARLEHPGVAPIYSLYRDEQGRPCYTMRFIEGQTLADAIRDYHADRPDPVAFRRLLQSFIQVCETVAYAHSRGVIHRDLKPQNVMLGKFGETMVVDWGLAKIVGHTEQDQLLNPEPVLQLVNNNRDAETEMGAAVGTPAYMSPEQAAGRRDVIDHRTDVYGLGAVLYALLTGRPPLQGDNWPEFEQKIQQGDFPRPCTVKRTVPRALEAICLKAMALDIEQRYSSARVLATEVEQWLADEPVQAYRDPLTERVQRWARRHKGLVGGSAVTLVLLIVSGWVISLTMAEASYQQSLAETNRGLLDWGQGNRERNAKMAGDLAHRLREFDKEASRTLDRIAGTLDHTTRLQESLRFWDKAIELDTHAPGAHGERVPHYRSQRALCLARLGKHERASQEAATIKTQLSGEVAYNLARVYALCAAKVKDNGVLAEQYADQAMKFLREAAAADYFEKNSNAQTLDTEPDLAPLRPRQDFGNLLREVKAKLK